YLANLENVATVSPQIAKAIIKELKEQRSNLKLIASENYSSIPTQSAMGNLLTDKYAEGFPYHRFYAGCDNVDEIEAVASAEACKLFNAQYAYVQPHSGADANLVAYWAILNTRIAPKVLKEINKEKLGDLTDAEWAMFRKELGNQKLLGLDYYSGGHLTHGYRYNVSAQMFDVHSYSVEKETNLLDYDRIAAQVKQVKPLILLAGYSAYPRAINFKTMREIADTVGAVFMVDMAHFAGLVAGGVFTGDFNPVAHAHVVTTTTHKTLRGPRGGMVLATEEFREQVEKGCPLVLGGPLPHVMAAKAISFIEAGRPEFKTYAHKIVENSRAMAAEFMNQGVDILTGGTDNHLMLVNVKPFELNGRQAEGAVRECNFTLNRNSLPFDPNGPWYTSGLRIGTPAVTTLGMGVSEMKEIAIQIKKILAATKPTKQANGELSKAKYEIEPTVKAEVQKKVSELISRYPLYPEIDLSFLEKEFASL
nr:glycine hydroxymethyltransferase [Pseudomonadota bacterium]